jgi:hypothetical protein
MAILQAPDLGSGRDNFHAYYLRSTAYPLRYVRDQGGPGTRGTGRILQVPFSLPADTRR